MGLSILIARILALTYIAAGIGAVSGRIKFEQMVADFEKSPALTYVSGFFTLVIGMLMVTYHNVWTNNWTVIITIVGWMSLIKGIMLIAFPGYISFFKNCYKNTRIWGILMMALGILFGYFGFLMSV